MYETPSLDSSREDRGEHLRLLLSLEFYLLFQNKYLYRLRTLRYTPRRWRKLVPTTITH